MTELLHTRCLLAGRADATALAAPEEGLSIDYGGLRAAVESLSTTLAGAGIGRGSRVALLAPPSPGFIVGMLAAMQCGAAAAPVDLSLRGLSLAAALNRLNPDAVVGIAATLSRLPDQVTTPRVTIAIESVALGSPDGLVATARIGDTARRILVPLAGPPAASLPPGEGTDSQDDAALIATSGSTGMPKFVRLSHAALLFNARGHLAALGLRSPFSALQALDATYSYGLVASLIATLVAGGTVVLPRDGEARSLREALRAARPEVCLASPALFEYLADTCPEEDRPVFGHLRKIGIGGDHCREPLRRKIRAFLPEVEAYVTYGSTEAGPRIATLPADQFLQRPQSVGLPLDGVSLAVLDERGEPCAPGTAGMLHVRTPSRMSGYLGSPPDGPSPDWLAIGDLASLDPEGFLTIHGRTDRQFKHRGRRINPAQIELVIEQLPGVVAARVETGGDQNRLRAVVMHRPDAQADLERRLREHCRRNLPGRLVPAEFVTVVESDGYFFKGRRLSIREALV